jgi:hypothetical protein
MHCVWLVTTPRACITTGGKQLGDQPHPDSAPAQPQAPSEPGNFVVPPHVNPHASLQLLAACAQ